MKRLFWMLSLPTALVVSGLLAMAWANRGSDRDNATDEPREPITFRAQSPKPIPLPAREPSSDRGDDPFARLAKRNADRTAATDEVADESQAQPAARGRDPFGLRASGDEQSGGYVERTAAAEPAPADEPAQEPSSEDPGEPRELADSQASEEEKPVSPPPRSSAFAKSRPTTNAPSKQPARKPAPPADESADEPTDEPAEAAVTPAEPTPKSAAPADEGASADAPAEASDAVSGEGSGRPGGQQLEGPQVPSLSIEKQAPAEIQVGKPAMFTITVRNTGSVVAQDVEVHDVVPKGTRLAGTSPKAAMGAAGALVWDLGALKPSEEKTVQVQLMPLSEGEIGSTASVHFRAEATARTLATRPALALRVSGPPQAMIGQEVELKISVSNPGSGAATGVIVNEIVPKGLEHAAGSELEFEIGTLKPGEARELTLALTAASAGPVKNVLRVRGDANLAAEETTDLEIVAPDLKVAMSGPRKRYLERTATYSISVSNPGTAPAKDVELVTMLPKGLKFVTANNSGTYDAATHSVYWSLEELPPQETGSVSLTALAIEPGDLKLKIKGQAKQGLADQAEETIVVEGLSAVQFELTDVNDPVELNGETTYEVRVTNQGSKSASNIRLTAIFPAELQPLNAEGPVRHSIEGQKVVFDSLNQLAPKADTTYTVKVKALQAGDQRIRVQVLADDLKTPITKEESTKVYTDE
jgi:uncharacterized repeat protein (TIGR01451 family)